MQEESIPKIRQAVFIVDKARLYKFDVNQNITIRNLKKMIVAAANLKKNGLRIYHSGIEYTDKDEQTLEELFPSLQLVEFNLSIVVRSEEELETFIKVKFKPYCDFHQFKYPYFYCYECKKSICSVCVQSNKHNGHDYIEKYDYLQSSRNLVEQIFYDLKEVLTGAKTDSEAAVETLRQKISIQFFPQLIEMIRLLESKLINMLDFFFEHERLNFKNIQGNVTLLKNHCAEGLDKLKSEIAIEDMMLDEQIFLTFDRKFKDIAQEKGKIHSDMKKYQEVREQLKVITETVETIYTDIYGFIQKYVNSPVFNEVQTKILDNTIVTVSKDDIFKRLLSDINKGKTKGIWSKLAKNISAFPNLSEASQTPTKKPTEQPIVEATKKSSASVSGKDKPLIIGQILPNSNQILFFSSNSPNTFPKKIEFNSLHGIPHFLIKCAWVNQQGKVFVSGGLYDNKPSPVFLSYDTANEELKRFPDMIVPRHSHSLFYHNDCIYAVGGSTNTTEKFDMKESKWIQMSDLVSEERYHPVLWVQNNFLYAFFGESSKGFLNSIEKIHLKSPKSKWEPLAVKAKGVNLFMYGCGIIQYELDVIYMLGGKDEKGLRSSALHFNFSTLTFEDASFQLEDPAQFQESKLVEVSPGVYGHFSLDQNNSFIKVLFS